MLERDVTLFRIGVFSLVKQDDSFSSGVKSTLSFTMGSKRLVLGTGIRGSSLHAFYLVGSSHTELGRDNSDDVRWNLACI